MDDVEGNILAVARGSGRLQTRVAKLLFDVRRRKVKSRSARVAALQAVICQILHVRPPTFGSWIPIDGIIGGDSRCWSERKSNNGEHSDSTLHFRSPCFPLSELCSTELHEFELGKRDNAPARVVCAGTLALALSNHHKIKRQI